MSKINNSDYVFLSAKVRTMERNLLSRNRLDQMLEAHSDLDAVRVLMECGYPEVTEVTADSINAMLSEERNRVFREISVNVPNREVTDIFKVKYDYHNVKVILKSEALGLEEDRLLMDIGRVPVHDLQDAVRTSEYASLPAVLKGAITEAREVLNTTRNPRLADTVLDRAYFKDMRLLADAVASSFMQGYVRTSIDLANMKSIVRSQRIGKGVEFLEGSLFEGGDVTVKRIVSVVSGGGSVEELYQTSTLKPAAEAGAAAVKGTGSLTQFEKVCDNAMTAYIGKAKYSSFSEAPIVAFLTAKENDLTAVRIIMTGRMAGLSAETIRERLRDCYV